MDLALEPVKAGAVFLNPGDFRFYCPAPGKAQPSKLHTLLGSCVSMVLWHPERRMGGMSHVILPSRSGPQGQSQVLDGRYCDEAVALFKRELMQAGTMPGQFQVYVVGGGRMYVTRDAVFSVGNRNVDAARVHLKRHGFLVRAEHVGADYHRKVELDLTTGVVTVVCNNARINLTDKPR